VRDEVERDPLHGQDRAQRAGELGDDGAGRQQVAVLEVDLGLDRRIVQLGDCPEEGAAAEPAGLARAELRLGGGGGRDQEFARYVHAIGAMSSSRALRISDAKSAAVM